MTQYAIPGYHPLESPKNTNSIRIDYYAPLDIEVPDSMVTWRLLAYVGFNGPKLLKEGDTNSDEYSAGPPKKVSFDFHNDPEDYITGSFIFYGLDAQGHVVIEKGIEISD